MAKNDRTLGITPAMKKATPLFVETVRALGWNPRRDERENR